MLFCGRVLTLELRRSYKVAALWAVGEAEAMAFAISGISVVEGMLGWEEGSVLMAVEESSWRWLVVRWAEEDMLDCVSAQRRPPSIRSYLVRFLVVLCSVLAMV